MADNPTPPPVPDAARTKLSGMAIASLVLGLLGFCGITAILGLAFGIIAVTQIHNSKGLLAGQGAAVAGIIFSALFLVMIPVGMILPVVGAGKRRAVEVSSGLNEKRLAIAIRIYAGNHTNQFPPATTWCDAIKPYASPGDFVRPGTSPDSRCGYAFNAALDGWDVSKVDPRTVMIFESAGWNATGGANLMRASGYATAVAYADGSVQMVPKAQLSDLRWNP